MIRGVEIAWGRGRDRGLGSVGLLHEVVFLMRPGTRVGEGAEGDVTKPRPQRGFCKGEMRSHTRTYLVSTGTW